MAKKKVSNERVTNGLTSAIMGCTGMGEQLSQLDTIRRTLRFNLISNNQVELSELYVENGLVQALVDIPVDDALRGGLEIHTKQLEPDEIEKLQTEMEDEDDLQVLGYGGKWSRLYGGGAVIARTDQDPKTPLNIEKLKKGARLAFLDVDLWQLYNQDMINSAADSPEGQLRPDQEFFLYNGMRIHKSRVQVIQGRRAPFYVRQRLRGWGTSEIEHLIRSINQFLKANSLSFEVLDEFKIDIYKVKGMNNSLLDPQGENLVKQRIQLANYQKNYQNAITMDSEDDFTQKNLSFAGLSEVMTGVRMEIASAMRIPLSKLFGIGSQGFSSGEDDIENYNCMVEGTVRKKLRKPALNIVKLRCQQLFGFVPDDLRINFKPLRELSSQEEETVKDAKFNRNDRALARGAMSAKEFKQACNKDQLLSVKIEETDELDPPEPSADGDAGVTPSPSTNRKAPKAKEAE